MKVKEGLNVNFGKRGQKKQNVGLSKVRKFVKDINSGKINNTESAVDRYLKDISPDKDFLDATKIIYGAPSYILKEIFNDLEYAVFGSLGPKNRKKQDNKQEKQLGQGLRIMTSKQMITRLPILLAELKAGNNSQKLKTK